MLSEDLLKKTKRLTEEEEVALTHLLMSCREGNHILCVSHELAKRLHKVCGLAAAAAATLTRAANQHPQALGLIAQLEIYGIVSDVLTATLDTSTIPHILRLPLVHFSRMAACQSTTLVGENVVDAQFALVIAETYRTRHKLGVPLECVPQGGGGAEIGVTFQQQRATKRFTLAIVDSDKCGPTGPCGSTAKSVLDQVDTDSPWAGVLTLRVREAENLLSLKQLEELCSGSTHEQAAVERLRALEDCGLNECLSYVDLKDGQTLRTILAISDEATKDWWYDQLRAQAPKLKQYLKNSCLTGSECESELACVCTVAFGFGQKVLKRSVEMLGGRTPHWRNRSLCVRTAEQWDIIGRVVLSWCCSSHPQLT